MSGYYERLESKAAKWCLRMAVLAMPFLLLTVLFHRSGAVTTLQAFWLLAVGIAMILAGLMFGLKAAFDLWERGYKGGRATVNGIVLGTLLLTPFGLQFLNALEHPQLNDVSTDVVTPPRFLSSKRVADDQQVYDDFVSRVIVSSYPQLIGRRYDAPPERVLESALEILNRWGWQRVADLNLPAQILNPSTQAGQNSGDIEDDSASEDAAGNTLAGDEEELDEATRSGESSIAIADIVIEARARSFLMKLPYSLVIRLRDENGSTLIDMRSASDWGPHDFGSNADNITDFLNALDASLAGLAGET